MKKNLNWKVNVDGETHIVRCETFKTVFDVYVDDNLAIRMPRRNEEGTDMEEEIRVGGKACRFVVYGGEPDLCVDGVLQGAQRDMERRDLRNRILMVLGGLFVSVISSYAAFLWYVFEAAGEPIFGGIAALICILFFDLAGLVLMICGIKPRKKY